MTSFPELPDETGAAIRLEDTDRPLPKKISQRTRYAYFKTIARGGKSIIQSCKDLHLGRVICYKKLRPEFADDAIEQTRFLREARVSALLQHPNTVPTYELGRDPTGHYYFTMKLVHGYTLREVLDFRERYDLKRLIDVIIQVAYALEYAHARRVVHRDIKPENILVGRFGEVLLLDWGLAKVWDDSGDGEGHTDTAGVVSEEPVTSITGQGELQGTVSYMSPEQLRRDVDIDHRTDIYSLGAVLFEVLAGRTPFVCDTVREMSEAIQNTSPQAPSTATGYPIPKLLDTLALSCIAQSPAQRPRSCGEMVRLLQEDW